ncbi:PspA/IM30 family protein, partial [Vibrio cholerae]
MSIFSRLVAGFVGKAEAKAEAVADKNAIPELEHYIRQAEDEIQK